VPSLPGAGFQGESVDEAIAKTTEPIRLMLKVLREEGKEIPQPNEIVVKVTVAA
jgi:predicted RNase H-like HicB family nuclease